MPTDDAEARDLFVATVAGAQCSRLCQILDQVRDFLERGSAGESESRSPSDLSAARASVESRLMRIGVIASALSPMGLDAEIGDLPISKLIRNFWGSWTPRKLAELELCLTNAEGQSFKLALTHLQPLIKCHDLLHRYFADVRNRRDHNPEVHAFLKRQLEPVEDDSESLTTLHGRGLCITLAGVAAVLGVTHGHARRVLRKLELHRTAATTRHGAKLYNIELLATACRAGNISLHEPVRRSVFEESRFFRRRTDPPCASAPRSS